MAALIVAGVVSLAWCFFAIWLGPQIGYVDRPDDSTLKAHDRPAVALGGVGVFLGVNAAGLMRSDLEWGLLLATTMVLILGLIDDRVGIDPMVRLGVELLAAVVLVLSVAPNPGIVFMVLSVALAVFAINSVNLFDGLDGLVGSVGLVTAAGLAVIAGPRLRLRIAARARGGIGRLPRPQLAPGACVHGRCRNLFPRPLSDPSDH